METKMMAGMCTKMKPTMKGGSRTKKKSAKKGKKRK